MPAAPTASRTPASGGNFTIFLGASGDRETPAFCPAAEPFGRAFPAPSAVSPFIMRPSLQTGPSAAGRPVRGLHARLHRHRAALFRFRQRAKAPSHVQPGGGDQCAGTEIRTDV